MRTLRLGCEDGDDVEAWQYFLRGQGLYFGQVDRSFGPKTDAASRAFQKREWLLDDGVVGNATYARAMQLGFGLVRDDDFSSAGPNWPPNPEFPPLSYADRIRVFGSFSFEPAGTASNPEAVRVLGDWVQKNIVSVEIPQLRGVSGTGGATKFQFHRLAAPQVQALFSAWEKAGLLPKVLSWGGSYVARFVRGSRTYLSNHCYGSAFDVNAAQNPLGAVPVKAGRPGSVRELVPLANRLGFYWGGKFKRADGMHFEIAKILTAEEISSVLSS